MKPTFITPMFAVAPQIAAADLETCMASGFAKVINNRPDGEADGQPRAADMAAEADRLGLPYAHLPATKFDLFSDEMVDAMSAALDAEGPVLAHCQSGMRSAIVWAAAEARRRPVAEILAELSAAGFELDFLRDELDTQAARDLSVATVGEAKARAAQRRAA